VSYAARPRREHRSAVGAQRRPPQHEPLAGAACRDALKNGIGRTAVMGRKPTSRNQRFHAWRFAQCAVEQLK
jgi:hypothetical protein